MKAKPTKPDATRETVLVTPTLAEEWMKKNINNRPFKQPNFEQILQSMINDEWTYNGDAIRFSKSGILLDGQHRLKAIIVSGKSYYMDVVQGLDEDAGDTMDKGTKRSNSDDLARKGVKNAQWKTPAVRDWLFLQKGRNILDYHCSGNKRSSRKDEVHLTDTSQKQLVLDHDIVLQEMVSTATKVKNEKGTITVFSPSEVLALMMYLHMDMGYSIAELDGFFCAIQGTFGSKPTKFTHEFRTCSVKKRDGDWDITRQKKFDLLKITFNDYFAVKHSTKKLESVYESLESQGKKIDFLPSVTLALEGLTS